MPDIGETYPVNPIWPTKPGKGPERRKRPKPAAEREKKRRDEQEREGPDDRPHIDDYA